MSKLNRLKFEEYSSIEYLTTQEDAEAHFRMMYKFPKVVGYDKKSNGFLVIHKRHSASGLESEIPACSILKKLGYRVILVAESTTEKSLDAMIDDIAFEIKCFSEGKDLQLGVRRHFKRTYKKSKNLLLHIDRKIDVSNLRRAIRSAASDYKKIETVLLLYRFKVVLLDKEMMNDANYDL